MLGREGMDGAEHVSGKIRVHGNPQHRPRAVGDRARRVGTAPGGLDSRARLGKEGAPRGAQLDTARVALEQPHPELGFQTADLLRQRGLRDREPLRGPPEVKLLGDHDERRQEAKVDLHQRRTMSPPCLGCNAAVRTGLGQRAGRRARWWCHASCCLTLRHPRRRGSRSSCAGRRGRLGAYHARGCVRFGAVVLPRRAGVCACGSRSGHEWVGIVEDVGSEVTGLRRGDRVLAPFTLAGDARACDHGASWGAASGQGGQAEAIRAPSAALVRVPSAVEGDDAALLRLVALADALPSGHHAALCAGVAAGSVATVIGDGATALCAVLACRRLGAERIIVLGNRQRGLELACRLGATDVIDSDDSTAVAQVVETTGGGPACALQCASTEEAMRTACAIVRPGGAIGYTGGLPGAADGLDRFRLRADGIVVRGGVPPARAYIEELMDDVVAGRLDPAPVLDLQLPLDRVGDAYAAMDDGIAIKAVVRP
jgi:threonine dehydrogenase-like Zn-dependent dehydrogenase